MVTWETPSRERKGGRFMGPDSSHRDTGNRSWADHAISTSGGHPDPFTPTPVTLSGRITAVPSNDEEARWPDAIPVV